MKNSRDIALIIMFAVLLFIFMALVGQVPNLITGIQGIGYAFTIIYSIIMTVSWLLYNGRRWCIFFQGLLMTILVFSFVPAWTLFTSIITILNMFIVDVFFNSLYKSFKRRDKLFRWIFFAGLAS